MTPCATVLWLWACRTDPTSSEAGDRDTDTDTDTDTDADTDSDTDADADTDTDTDSDTDADTDTDAAPTAETGPVGTADVSVAWSYTLGKVGCHLIQIATVTNDGPDDTVVTVEALFHSATSSFGVADRSGCLPLGVPGGGATHLAWTCTSSVAAGATAAFEWEVAPPGVNGADLQLTARATGRAVDPDPTDDRGAATVPALCLF